jgi:hypothetical protein
MNYRALAIFVIMVSAVSCSERITVKSSGPSIEDVLISRGFINDNSYRIVCRGYPQGGLDGVQKVESSKRGALLNAYYFVQAVFDDSVAPDRDGKAEKFDVMNDYAIVHYLVTKKDLKKRVKRK